MKFKVLVPKENLAILKTSNSLAALGVRIVDVGFSTLNNSTTGEAVYDVCVLNCKSTKFLYKTLMKHFNYSEKIMDGIKVLF